MIDQHKGEYTVECLQQLKNGCHIKTTDLQKLRICYDLSKDAPDTVDLELPAAAEPLPAEIELTQLKATAGLINFQLNPKGLHGEQLLDHMLQFGRRMTTTDNFLPSEYLDVAITADQRKFLNPSARGFTMGEIMKAAGGEGAEKRLAKRRLDATGHIQSHCVELSDPVRQKRLKSQLQLAASIAEIARITNQESKEKKAQENLELDKALP